MSLTTALQAAEVAGRARPAGRSPPRTEPEARKEDEMLLERIASRLGPELLDNFGVAYQAERASTYYLVQAEALHVEPKATNLLVTLGTPEGHLLRATLSRFP